MKRVLAALVIVVILGGCSNPAPTPTLTSGPAALEMMEATFEGTPSQHEIQALLDPAMAGTGLEITEAHYQKAGSVLVALAHKDNIAEMTILKCMPLRLHDSRIQAHDFPSVAAVCAVDIMLGDFRA